MFNVIEKVVVEFCVVEIFFDFDCKLMIIVYELKIGGFLVFVKGVLDELLKCCMEILLNGEISLLDEIKC